LVKNPQGSRGIARTQELGGTQKKRKEEKKQTSLPKFKGGHLTGRQQ